MDKNIKKEIDEAFISTLVETFYSRVHEDKTLGPIFDRVVDGNWEAHLDKMKKFWSSIILRSGKYSGKPMPMHQKITDIEPEHFKIWLSLFEETLNDISPSKEITEHFILRANQIGKTLQAGIFTQPQIKSL